jgi:hypothetical protein
MLEKVKKIVKQLDQTTRRFNIDSGIIAVSPRWCSHAKKTASVGADPQNRPITVALSHLYFVPPHSKARRNWMAAGAKRQKPGISRDSKMDRNVRLVVCLTRRSGMWIKRMNSSAMPPIGRLM